MLVLDQRFKIVEMRFVRAIEPQYKLSACGICMPGQPTSRCLVSNDMRENVLLQVVQEYFLISEWV